MFHPALAIIPWRKLLGPLAITVTAAALVVGGYWKGLADKQAQWDLANAKAAQADAEQATQTAKAEAAQAADITQLEHDHAQAQSLVTDDPATVARELAGMCPGPKATAAPVPTHSPPSARRDGHPRADTHNAAPVPTPMIALAAEIPACVRNTNTLAACQAYIRTLPERCLIVEPES